MVERPFFLEKYKSLDYNEIGKILINWINEIKNMMDKIHPLLNGKEILCYLKKKN